MTTLDPVQILVNYLDKVKPYRTKIIETNQTYNIIELVNGRINENVLHNIKIDIPSNIKDLCINGYGIKYDDSSVLLSTAIAAIDISNNTISVVGDQTNLLLAGIKLFVTISPSVDISLILVEAVYNLAINQTIITVGNNLNALTTPLQINDAITIYGYGYDGALICSSPSRAHIEGIIDDLISISPTPDPIGVIYGQTNASGAYYDISNTYSLYYDSTGIIRIQYAPTPTTVGLIKDISVHNNDILQPTTSDAATFNTNTLTANGTTNWYTLPPLACPFAPATYIMSVDIGTIGFFMSRDMTGAAAGQFGIIAGSHTITISNGASIDTINLPTTIGNTFILSIEWGQTYFTVYVNGTLLQSNTASYTTDSSNALQFSLFSKTYGGTGILQGNFNDGVLFGYASFNQILSIVDRESIEKALATKAGIVL